MTIEWKLNIADNGLFVLLENGKHFANVRFVDQPDFPTAARRMALIQNAPALAERLAWSLPRLHAMLTTKEQQEQVRALLDEIAGKRCRMCGRFMDTGAPEAADCGGDCRGCMAAVGDPDAAL